MNCSSYKCNTTRWHTKCHTIDCARNTFLLLQKHLTSDTELILIGWKIVPNEEHVQCDHRFASQPLANEPLHSSQLFDTSLQKVHGTTSLCGPWAALLSEVVPRTFWRLISKSCDECKGSFARGCEAKWWSHWTCSSLGTIFQPMRINSVPGVKCFCNKKMCYMHNQWYDISCATLYVTFGVFAVVSPKVLFVSIVTLHHLVTGTQRSTAMQCPITLTDP